MFKGLILGNSRPSVRLRASSSFDVKVLEQPRLLYAIAPAYAHDSVGHAECSQRVPSIMSSLESHALTCRSDILHEESLLRPASVQDICLVHNARYIEALERICLTASPAGDTVDTAPTYVTPSTHMDALLAAGTAINLVDAVIEASYVARKSSMYGFVVARPPGHHALPKGAMGFCIFNTVAIAIRHAMKQHSLKKIALFDWDVHHGNGSNDFFWNDPDVLFISTHQLNAYPGTGAITEVGEGDGEGFSINIPLPGDTGHEGLLAAFDEVVCPALRRHQPEMIFVSAGYDAHWRDPLGGLQARARTFHALAERMATLSDELCHGRMVLVLEGGYDLEALGQSVASTFLGLVREPCREPWLDLRDEPMDKVKAVIKESQSIHGI